MANLVYDIKDKPPLAKLIVLAFQQLLSIITATIAVPIAVNSMTGLYMSQSAALFGAGAGTLVYLLFTRFKSPVFLGSSFTFAGSMATAITGAITMSVGYFGLILGAFLAGLVYVILALIVKYAGVKWINKIMPVVVIGPTVAIIGLSLAPGAISNLQTAIVDANNNRVTSIYVCIVCGLLTMFITMFFSTYGRRFIRVIPFVFGIIGGYLIACIFIGIGSLSGNDAFKVIDFSKFNNMEWIPDFIFIEAFGAFKDFNSAGEFFSFFGTVAVAYIPVAFVSFAEHIADHKNLSTIINHDLLEEPGLKNTLLGDGVGSMVGSLFGGCANTTYGESVGCVAISRNASVITIIVTSFLCMMLAFFGPFVTMLSTIPKCVIGGITIILYGFIGVSGLKMIQNVDLNDNRNLFVVSVILICGVGNFIINFGKVTITNVAVALIIGILVNLFVHIRIDDKKIENVTNNDIKTNNEENETLEENSDNNL